MSIKDMINACIGTLLLCQLLGTQLRSSSKMLTVLIRYKESRREVIFPAISVEFVPSGTEDAGLLINTKVDGETHLALSASDNHDWRDVFVMNANGQTVARYTL